MGNNTILWVISRVIKIDKKKRTVYYVLWVCADLSTEEVNSLITSKTKFTFSRATALFLAHDMQKKLWTQHKVCERSWEDDDNCTSTAVYKRYDCRV